MERTHKKFIGVLGLVLVAALTFFASTIEGPDTSAVSSIDDTIVVRVMGTTPKINVSQTGGEEATTADSSQILKIDYENVNSIEIKMTYTNTEGVSREYTLSDSDDPKYNPTQVAGTLYQSVNLAKYGAGRFVFAIKATGMDGVVTTDAIAITYAPVITNIEINPIPDPGSGETGGGGTSGEPAIGNPGDAVITVNYDETEVDPENSVVKVCINGNEKCFEYPINELPADGKIVIPSNEFKPGDTITVEVIAHDKDGNKIEDVISENNDIKYEDPYNPGGKEDEEETAVPNTGSPNTGGLFKDLNISKEDYIITGLIVFFVFGVVAFGIVAKGRKNKR